MPDPPNHNRLPSLWSALRRAECGVGPRVLASLTTAMLCAGLAFLVTWTYAWRWGRARVDERFLATAIALAAVCWLPLQIWIWIAGLRGARIGRTIAVTVILWAAVIPACVATDAAFWRTGRLLVTALVLLAGAITLLIWSPAILRVAARRAFLTADGHIDVRCPECGYSLVGLRELRCPECGAQFTIDELIRSQRFALDRPPRQPPDRCSVAVPPRADGGASTAAPS